MRVLNQSRDREVAAQAELAQSFFARLRGLMGREQFRLGQGLLITPCTSIHMFFMRFALDVVFLDRQGQVVGLRKALPPWAPYAGAPRTRAVLELPVGAIEAGAIELGDQLSFEPPVRL